MEKSNLLYYAKKNIQNIVDEYSINVFKSSNDKLFLEMPSGRTFELSDKEIKYQAIEFLKNEIADLEINF